MFQIEKPSSISIEWARKENPNKSKVTNLWLFNSFYTVSLSRAFLVFGFLLNTNCATTYKGKVFESSLMGAVVGGAYGYSRPEAKDQNAMLYGSMGVALGALIQTLYLNPDKEIKDIKLEALNLKTKLDEFQKPNLIDQGNSLYKSSIPMDLTKLVQPGEWKRYKIDYWVQDQSNQNQWFRQTEMFEVIPPSPTN